MENYQKENQKNIFRQCEKMSEYFILSDDTVLSEKLNCVLLHITFYVFGLRLTREKLMNVWLIFEMLRRVTRPKHISILPMITVFFYLDCDVNLGLGNYKLPDSSITAGSVYNSQYNTSKIRLDRKGWCPLSKTEESWVKIDLLKVGVISDTSSLQEVFYKRNIFRNFAKFTGKHLRQSFFFKHRCFPVNFAKFLR